ncbi:hypothetical protein RB620_17920 [Paenibacillus sp. LHD-117]|uniref:hypothetical protein n=1 Tax=Paenibacillus sp. LHD-117 TaxID=3071412 RepID=UPI0027DEEBEC|nr:hypothetical protein [Paenibacillus sp. LHD-117]MDQ6421306.1 hypothetical protein [Paenibacillus sp. LHD-117]
MLQDWVTIVLLAFGIAVGISGVVAYLRLFRKEKLFESQSAKDASLADKGPDAEQKPTKG